MIYLFIQWKIFDKINNFGPNRFINFIIMSSSSKLHLIDNEQKTALGEKKYPLLKNLIRASSKV